MRPDPDDEPVLPAQSAEEAGIGWGEAPEPAAGQAVAASGSGALAQATSDLIPYSLLAATCLVTRAALLAMSLAALDSGSPRTAAGGALFVASDTLLALEKFGDLHLPAHEALVMATYTSAQALLAG